MVLNIKTTTKPEDAANFVASKVLEKLKSGEHVLLFLTGGSSVPIGAQIAELLKQTADKKMLQNLSITLTDERYGKVGHPDSNWYQLEQKGFDVPDVKLISVLAGKDQVNTVVNFNKNLNEEFTRIGYKIGLFGIGKDGHTAGILPETEAIHSEDLAFGYDTPTFSRITITPKSIEKLDEVVVWAQGEDKWKVLKDLQEEIDTEKQPAQILKKVPLLTIFSDMKM